MNNELNNMRNPARIRILWVAFYIFVIAMVIYGLSFITTEIKTHIIPTGNISLVIPYSKYVVGEKIDFTIKNGFNSSISILNNCPNEPLAVYRQENGKWVRQHDKAPSKDCPSQKRQVDIPAGGTISGDFGAWHNLFSRTGKCRVVAIVEYYNSLPFQEFEIIAKPQPSSFVPAAQLNQIISNQPIRNSQPVFSATTSPVVTNVKTRVLDNDESDKSSKTESDD